jgi:uncharacterized protein YllA (UPF0747 family)
VEEQDLRSFSEAFLKGDARAEPFLPGDFRKAEARRAHVMRTRGRASALVPQGSVAVVTGQQVGLFLGPMYSVYKAATAIACARALEQETGVRCVPVFWLQTEDHDLEEIDHCFVLERHEVLKLQLKLTNTRCSVEHLKLGESVGPLLEHVDEFFRRHWRPEATFADAFAGALAELFEGQLLIVNPCRLDAPEIHARAMREAPKLSQLMLERERALEQAGFEVQVRTRPESPLSFFHPEGAKGPRYRLVSKGDTYTFVGREGAVTREVAMRGPFSTSALLRPIVQDTLLPTAAIVGGPGELNYFAQMKPLYDAFGVPMPMLVPRARFQVLDERTKALRDAPAPAVGLPPEALEKNLIAAVDAQLSAVPQSDAGVADAVKITRGTIARAASRLAGRYRRQLETAGAVAGQRAERVQKLLMPNGQPQERVLALPSFAKLGLKKLKDAVLSNIDPWNPQLKELVL